MSTRQRWRRTLAFASRTSAANGIWVVVVQLQREHAPGEDVDLRLDALRHVVAAGLLCNLAAVRSRSDMV